MLSSKKLFIYNVGFLSYLHISYHAQQNVVMEHFIETGAQTLQFIADYSCTAEAEWTLSAGAYKMQIDKINHYIMTVLKILYCNIYKIYYVIANFLRQNEQLQPLSQCLLNPRVWNEHQLWPQNTFLEYIQIDMCMCVL